MSWPPRLRPSDPPSPAAAPQSTGTTCPRCATVNAPDARVCRVCGLPVRPDDRLRVLGPGRLGPGDERPNRTKAVVAVVTAAVLLVITGALAISDLGILEPGVVSDAVPSVSPSAAPSRSRDPFVTPGPIPARTEPPVTAPPEAPPAQGSPYTCDDREIRAASRSRWQLRGVLAGSRRGFERVTLELARLGPANRPARITIEWMSPEEARDTFGLPRFDGQSGILVTFGGQVTTPGTQLIGPVDLRGGGMESISGVYRFVDAEGQVRTFIAIRDGSCARVRAPELVDTDRTSRRATILVDLAVP